MAIIQQPAMASAAGRNRTAPASAGQRSQKQIQANSTALDEVFTRALVSRCP